MDFDTPQYIWYKRIYIYIYIPSLHSQFGVQQAHVSGCTAIFAAFVQARASTHFDHRLRTSYFFDDCLVVAFWNGLMVSWWFHGATCIFYTSQSVKVAKSSSTSHESVEVGSESDPKKHGYSQQILANGH